ncbi:MAG: hypothetical protein KAT35_01460, partial [Candidatus Aenigmarchaeota archaeon]|nr:hypothetical protein [Candidatus Aenigmarchaeota archaeon]
ELSAGGPYNASEAGLIYATLRDSLGNYVNIIGSCYASFYYPNSSLWKGEQLNYIEGTNGSYYASFVAPQANGDFLVSTACSVPQASNSTTFNVIYEAPPPPPPPDDDDGPSGGSTGGAVGAATPSSDMEIEFYDSYVEIEQGESGSIVVGVTNTGNNTLEGVTVSIEGLDPMWYAVNPLVADILANITQNFSITLNIPYESLTGIYPYFIKAGAPSEEKRVESTVTVILKRKISIVGISNTVLIGGELGMIVVEVENTGETLETVGITIEAPPGWRIDETHKTREILPGRTEVFEFDVVPAQGTYNITITGTFSHGELSDTFAVTVRPPLVAGSIRIGYNTLIIVITVVLIAVYLILLVRKLLMRMKIKRFDSSVIKEQVNAGKKKGGKRKRMEETLDRTEETFEKAEKFLDKGDTGKALREYKKIKRYKKVLEKYGEESSLEELSERIGELHSRILARSEKKG